MSESDQSPAVVPLDVQLERHLLASPSAASSPSSSQLAHKDVFFPVATPSPATSPPLPCPQANLLHSWWAWPSYFTLSWLTPFILLGTKRTLRHSDLWDCYPSEHASSAYEAFRPHWEAAQEKAKAKGEPPKLGAALRGMVGWQFLLASLAYAWVPTDQLLGPQFLNQLVSYSAKVQAASDGFGPAPPVWDGYKSAAMHMRHACVLLTTSP